MTFLFAPRLAPGGKSGKPACAAMQLRRKAKPGIRKTFAMFKSILGFGRRPNREVTDALYEAIVASARQSRFYADWEVPDTPIGRFEMLSVHMFLFLERARGDSVALTDAAQDLTDEFFKDVEHSLRELGIGDLGVPKRMKKLAKMFYGRAEAYREAMETGDRAALAAALARNVCPGRAAWPQAAHLASYMEQAAALLSAQAEDDLLAGRLSFPAAEGVVP
jgi:cytochrome b pre-mRNA-processing protein 3